MTDLRSAVITGGSSGIGLAIARLLLADGYGVVIGGRDDLKLKAAADGLGSGAKVVAVVGDIADTDTGEAMVRAAVERFGGVDVLVNNAGTFTAKAFVDVTAGELGHFIDGNLRGTYFTTQAVVRQMIAQGRGGSIVNVGTVLNSHAITGFPASAPLASKGAIAAMTIALAAELAPYGIRVNEVTPGVVRTPLHDPASVDTYGALAVMNRIGEPDEIAEAIRYLAGAEFVTGHSLAVDGGFVTVRA